MDDPHDLARFVAAQEPVWESVLAELAAGAKRSHWMWFVFPQWRGLGHSATAQHFGIASREEALAYWHHPVLGERLRRCLALLVASRAPSAESVFGALDSLKLRSCLTLFEQVAAEEPQLGELLRRYYGGERDHATLARLQP